MFIFDSLRVITSLVKSVFFIHNGWRKRTESCHEILLQSRSICDRNVVLVQNAYGNEAVNQSKAFSWYSRFRDGRELVEDDERGDSPKSTRTEVNIAPVADLVKNDRRIASRMIAESFNIPKTVVLWVLKEDLGKRKLCARFVPRSLTPDGVTSCQDIAMSEADKTFFNKIITGDETWCFAYDPETKRQGSEWVGET